MNFIEFNLSTRIYKCIFKKPLFVMGTLNECRIKIKLNCHSDYNCVIGTFRNICVTPAPIKVYLIESIPVILLLNLTPMFIIHLYISLYTVHFDFEF